MVNSINLTGRVFERLTVVGPHPVKNTSGKRQWQCLCSCGTKIITNTGALTTGNTRSCGCLKIEGITSRGKSNKTHGRTGSSEYKTWQSMRDRCTNEKNSNYSRYGGRGISVCTEWDSSFESFYRDMGPRPDGMSLDRENNDGNYNPRNCRWANIQTQNSNKSTNRYFLYQGETITKAELSRRTGIPVATIDTRIRGGWDDTRIINTPVNHHEYTHNGLTMNLGGWAKHLNIDYNYLYSRVITKGLPFGDVVEGY